MGKPCFPTPLPTVSRALPAGRVWEGFALPGESMTIGEIGFPTTLPGGAPGDPASRAGR